MEGILNTFACNLTEVYFDCLIDNKLRFLRLMKLSIQCNRDCQVMHENSSKTDGTGKI